MSLIDIYNMAVARCGHSTPITDPLEKTNAANLCRTFYPTVRDIVLGAADWNFARQRKALALLSGATATNWAFVYGYPGDSLTLRSLVIPGMRFPRPDWRPPYEVAIVGGKKCILTDLQNAEAIYTARILDESLYEAGCVSALAYRLCADVAVPLTGKAEMGANALKGYMQEISAAQAGNLNEREFGPPPDCEFVTARGTGCVDDTRWRR